MIIFSYDKTFEGLLTVVFDAYVRKSFPDRLFGEQDVLPLFYEEKHRVYTDADKSDRVWKGLQKKLSKSALAQLSTVWLSELPQIDELIFQYIRLALDTKQAVELNFGHPVVLEMAKIWRKVNNERMRVMQFLRFQKMADQMYFTAVEPIYNVMPLVLPYLKDRFADQCWLIYDMKRNYGYYYDLKSVEEVSFEAEDVNGISGISDDSLLDKQEKMYQKLWKTYFNAIAIRERFNPRLHKQNLPVRFWKYLTEKQPD